MVRPPEESKPLSQAMAETFVLESSYDRVLELASEHGLPLAPAAMPPLSPNSGAEGVCVGIWREQIENGEKWFVRGRSEPLRLWADVDRIPPKRGKKRVILLGESAARGYFYDPHFTFAEAIKSVLSFAKADDLEVIDLARTDTVLPRLIKLMQEAAHLEPDVLVVFAGNNWLLTHDPPNFSMEELAGILKRGGGVAEIRSHCEEILCGLADEFLQSARAIHAERGVPIIFVLPEFNLMDWQNEKADQTPFRSSEDSTCWEATRQSAMRSIEDGDLGQAEQLAHKMIALDSGTTPAGYEILARCALRRSRFDDARSSLERAKDAGFFLPVMRSPRCYGVIQNRLRQEAAKNGVILIDLPKIYSECLRGELPDRRLFLDYCHLSVEGLRIAACAVTEQLLTIFGKDRRTWRELSQVEFNIPARVLAESLFQASIHNAHWGQGREIVEFQCSEALRLYPPIRETMLRFVDSSVRRAPSFICASMEKVAAVAAYQGAAALHLFNSLPPLRKNLSVYLIEALETVLTPSTPGLRDMMKRLLISEFCVGNAPCDLAQRAYSSTSLEDWDWLNHTIFYRARQPKSTFRFICCQKFPIRLTITARSRSLPASGVATLESNGRPVAPFSMSSGWETHQLELPADYLVEGMNSFSIRWPAQNFTIEDRLRTIGRDLEAGRIPTVPLIYAEIAELRATIGLEQGSFEPCSHTPLFWPEVAALLNY